MWNSQYYGGLHNHAATGTDLEPYEYTSASDFTGETASYVSDFMHESVSSAGASVFQELDYNENISLDSLGDEFLHEIMGCARYRDHWSICWYYLREVQAQASEQITNVICPVY